MCDCLFVNIYQHDKTEVVCMDCWNIILSFELFSFIKIYRKEIKKIYINYNINVFYLIFFLIFVLLNFLLSIIYYPVNENGAILVTGGSSGLGLHISLFLDKLGYKIYSTVRKEIDAAKIKKYQIQ